VKLLVVDDSSVIRSRIARLTRDERLPSLDVVGLASNGQEAVELCESQQPSVVTMDITMPEMDGVECTARLCQTLPSVRILIVSALNDKPTAIQAMKKGAHGFLYKPFTDDQLIDSLLEVVA
jgi:two-component system chemotaxis response regulator CheY